MHLSSRASQIDTSEAKVSFTNRYIPFPEASQKKTWMHPKVNKASDKTIMLEAVYKRIEAE